MLAITGIAVLGIHVRSLDALIHTGYGQTLIVKTALFLLAGAVGLATTMGLRLRRAPTQLRAIWSWAPRLEAAVLVALLVPAALLTASAPARESAVLPVTGAPPVAAAPKTFANVGDLLLSVAVEPNRPGQNFVTVGAISTRRPALAPIGAVTVSLTRPGSPTRSVTLAAIESDQWQGVTKLPAGTVRIGVAVTRPGLPAVTATTVRTVKVGPAPVATAPVQAAERGIMQRPLEPVLGKVAIGGAALLVLILLARLWLSRASSRLRPPTQLTRPELRATRVER